MLQIMHISTLSELSHRVEIDDLSDVYPKPFFFFLKNDITLTPSNVSSETVKPLPSPYGYLLYPEVSSLLTRKRSNP